jgi:hypothetical protein
LLGGPESPSLGRNKKTSAAATRRPADTATTMSCSDRERRRPGRFDPDGAPADARGVRVGVDMRRQDATAEALRCKQGACEEATWPWAKR